MRSLPALLGALSAVLLVAPAAAAVEPVVHQCLEPGLTQEQRWEAPTRVCRVDADGTGQQELAAEVGVALELPVLSPDGSQVAYLSAREGVVLMAADGTGRRVVAPGPYGPPRWSPDGTRLAFSGRDAVQGLWVADLVGGGLKRLHQGETGQPSWAPDGSALATAEAYWLPGEPTSELDYQRVRLVVVPLDGGASRGLGDHGPAVWSPDGAWLLTGTWLLAPDGSQRRELFTNPPPERQDAEGRTEWSEPRFSPDGSTVAYRYDTWVVTTQRGASGIGTMRVDGTDRRELSRHTTESRTYIGDRSPRWRPDGSELVFVRSLQNPDTELADSHSDVYAIRLDRSGFRRLTTGTEASQPELPTLVPRLAGATRTDTAVSVSRATRPSADAVVIARSDDFPDALSAAPLAAVQSAPLLLSPPDGVPTTVLDEVRRLGARTAWLVGDRTALSDEVEADLRAVGVTEVRRLAGSDRYATAAAVAREVGGTAAYVASGTSFPDAASVSALAAHERRPVLLTAAGAVPAATAGVLDELGATSVTVVGGPSVVSDAAAAQLGQGRTLDRLAGADRYATSAAVAQRSVAAGLGTGAPWLATGRGFADALAAGPGAAATGGVLLLVDPVSLDRSPASRDWLAARSRTARHVVAVGGPDVVSPLVTTTALRIVR